MEMISRPGASSECKSYGFKSLKEVAYFLDCHPRTLNRIYNQNEKLFFSQLSVAFEIKLEGDE